MAKDGPGGEKTEKPTPQRLKKARKDGQIPRTPELGTWAGVAAASVLLPMLVGKSFTAVQELFNVRVEKVRTQVRRKRFAERLRDGVQHSMDAAITDALTGLHNRRYLDVHLANLFDDAVRRVAAGGTVLDPEVVTQLMSRRRDPLGALTPREREVLGLMAEGRTNAAIARALVIGTGAVEKHVSSIFAKLGLEETGEDHRRVLAVLAYLG